MSTGTIEELEDRLRVACAAVIPHLLDDEVDVGIAPTYGQASGSVVSLTTHRIARRTRIASVAAAAVVIASAGVAFAVASSRHAASPAAPPLSSPSSLTVPPSVSLPCDDYGCHGFDTLPVVPGASDYYVGPESLGTPQFDEKSFDQTTRCAELTTDFTACAKIEGQTGVSLVNYAVDNSASANTVFDSTGGRIEIGTTFADVTIEHYAAEWGPTKGGGVQTATIVRGHAAIRFSYETSPAVVWQERPGVLAWVVVPPTQADQLMTIAEGIRSVPGPAKIASRVVVSGIGLPWDANDNDADGALLGRAGGLECFGFGHIDGCGQGIGDRTFVTPNVTSNVTPGDLVVGSTPSGVTAVRITTDQGGVATVPTSPFANFESRVFSSSVAGGVAKVEWLDVAGAVVATVEHAQPQSMLATADTVVVTTTAILTTAAPSVGAAP